MIHFQLLPPAATEAIRKVWLRLESGAQTSAFGSWHVVGPWLRHLPRDSSVRLVVGHTLGEPVVASWIAGSGCRAPLQLAQLTLDLGVAQDRLIATDYNDVLIRQGENAQEVLKALFDFLGSAEVPYADEILLPAMDEDAVALRHLRLAPPDGWFFEVSRTSASCFIDLEALRASGMDYLSYLGAATRKGLRRSLRKYEREGALVLRQASEPREAREVFDELVELHQKAWHARGRPGAFARPEVVRFHQDLIEAGQPSGFVQLLRLAVGAQTIGCLYNFVHRQHVYVYQMGFRYDPDLRPGMVTHCQAVMYNRDCGHLRYDFLPDAKPYKRQLARESRSLYWGRLYRPTVRAQVWTWLRDARSMLGRARALIQHPEGREWRTGGA